jgi:hypothetical protein
MRKPLRDTNKTRKAHEERNKRQLARYHVKIALMDTYEPYPEHHSTYARLKREVHRLRQQLIVKGVL